MIAAVIVGLAVLGSTTWYAQNYTWARDRARHRRTTAGLLLASAAAIVVSVVLAVVIPS